MSARYNSSARRCLPWLSESYAARFATVETGMAMIGIALAAYAVASPVAHARHAAILSALMQRGERGNLAKLTRRAVATGLDAA